MTAVAGICMLQVFFMGVPASAAVWVMALPRFLVLSSMTFLLCMIILVTMFLPKIFKSSFLGISSTTTNSENPRHHQQRLPLSQGGGRGGGTVNITTKEGSKRVHRVGSDVKPNRSMDDKRSSIDELPIRMSDNRLQHSTAADERPPRSTTEERPKFSLDRMERTENWQHMLQGIKAFSENDEGQAVEVPASIMLA